MRVLFVSGYGVVVDLDLEAFFDRINHDRLMSRLAQRIGDRRVLKLIRAYLQAGILENGLVKLPTVGDAAGWSAVAVLIERGAG